MHRSTLNLVSQHLLGPNGSIARVVFLRAGYRVLVEIERAPVPLLMSIKRADDREPTKGKTGLKGQ